MHRVYGFIYNGKHKNNIQVLLEKNQQMSLPEERNACYVEEGLKFQAVSQMTQPLRRTKFQVQVY